MTSLSDTVMQQMRRFGWRAACMSMVARRVPRYDDVRTVRRGRAGSVPVKTVAKMRRLRRKAMAQGGFSLLEVLIVLAIIALVVAVVGPRLIAQFDRSKVTAAGIQARALASAMETMRLDLGRYPSADEGLRLLVEPPASGSDAAALWRGPYLEGALPQDPWGRAYVYQPSEDLTLRPRIESLGADGKPGGTGLSADIAVGGP